MDVADQGMVLLQAFKRIHSIGLLNTGFSSDPEEVQQGDSDPDVQPESNQETPEQVKEATAQELIELRIQQLKNRRDFLLNMQHFRKREGDNSDGTPQESSSKASDDLCELEAIQKELEELLGEKEEMKKQGESSSPGQWNMRPTFHKPEPPRGGIYLLPPPQLTQEDAAPEQREITGPEAEGPTDSVVPVGNLGQTAAVTQCPSCQEVVLTETHSKVGDTTWILCCLSSSVGCVAGCCLIPFLVDRFRDVHHHCPRCQEHIHTFEPL